MTDDLSKEFEIILDVTAPKARTVLFPPAGGEMLRSELRLEHISGKTNGALQAVGGFIPGRRVYFSIKNNSAKIIDKMTMPEYERIDTEIRKLMTTDNFRHLEFGRYEKDIDMSVSKKEVPTWLYWIKRLVDAGRFTVVQGENHIPDYPEIIKMNGGQIIVSEDYGLKPLTKDQQPFNVVTLADFGIEEDEVGAAKTGAGK